MGNVSSVKIQSNWLALKGVKPPQVEKALREILAKDLRGFFEIVATGKGKAFASGAKGVRDGTRQVCWTVRCPLLPKGQFGAQDIDISLYGKTTIASKDPHWPWMDWVNSLILNRLAETFGGYMCSENLSETWSPNSAKIKTFAQYCVTMRPSNGVRPATEVLKFAIMEAETVAESLPEPLRNL